MNSMNFFNVETEIKNLKKQLHYSFDVSDRILKKDNVTIGFIYLKMGEKTTALTIFDDFINEHPKMIVVQDIKTLIKKLQNQI